jgi:predicted Zn finger-like uncharacterized protein
VSFITSCSDCDSAFRITSEQLTAARGWTQCGVCGAAFDARLTLESEDGEPLPDMAEDAVTEPQTGAGPTTAELPSPEAAAQARAATGETPPAQAGNNTGGGTSPSHLAVAGIDHRSSNPDLPSIILIEPDASGSEDMGPFPVIPAPAPVSSPTAPPRNAIPSSPSIPSSPASPPAGATDYPSPGWARRKFRSRRRIKGWVWAVLSLFLLLALLAQASYFLRDTLISQAPQTRPWLEKVCATLGCTLSLPKNAQLIQIIGSDLQAETTGKGHLKLKLTLGNRAPYAQAWPVLMLTLTDSKDRPQARRSFAPESYLADAKLLESGIPAQSEYPLTLRLDIRDLTLVGYRLQVTY